MNNRNVSTPTQTYKPERVNHVRTAVRSLFFMVIYHTVTWLLYVMIMSPIENQMVGDEREVEYRFFMFGFSILTLVILSIVMAVTYHKNGDRKRAYLAATSVELRGAEHIAEGASRYRRLALTEAMVSVIPAALLWLIPAAFYTAALSSSGMGYGYAEAWGLETFFVGAVGFFQPFQNAWVGLLVAMAILFGFHWLGRLFSHKSWTENRIRQ